MCNNKCARVNATYKFQTYKAITLFQAKLLLHNHIHPPRSIRICSLRLPRALESPTATTCRIPQPCAPPLRVIEISLEIITENNVFFYVQVK